MQNHSAVNLPETPYKKLQALASRRKTQVEDELLEAVKFYTEYRENYLGDPFFQLGNAGATDLGDLAENHDKYLYGTGAGDT